MPDMPVVTEQDLEQLEAYVDGELSTTEEDALRARLAAEPILAEAMRRVRADRDIRAAVWKGYEPSEASVARLVAKVDAALERETSWSYRLPMLRRVSAAAACIVLGVLIGRTANSTDRDGVVGPAGGPGTTVVQGPAPRGVNGGPGGATMVSNPIEFPIVNEQGQAVGVQRFQSTREAQEFIEELQRFHRLQEQIRNGGGQILVPSERF
jgi:anti-sigma factor RsiW